MTDIEKIEMTVPESYWKRVVFADECPPCDACGEPVCQTCEEHYADCDCPGPTQDGIIYEERNGVLYGRPDGEEDDAS